MFDLSVQFNPTTLKPNDYHYLKKALEYFDNLTCIIFMLKHACLKRKRSDPWLERDHLILTYFVECSNQFNGSPRFFRQTFAFHIYTTELHFKISCGRNGSKRERERKRDGEGEWEREGEIRERESERVRGRERATLSLVANQITSWGLKPTP